MRKGLAICALISACTAACSSMAPPRDANVVKTAQANQACAPLTATRIPLRPGECAITPGHSYSSQDIDRTGRPLASDALQLLDPSITIQH